MTVSPILSWPPTLDELQRDIDVTGDPRDSEELQAILDAAVTFVQRVRSDIDFDRLLIGETVILPLFVKNANGDLETPTTISLTITLPDGTTSVETLGAPTATGTYSHSYLTTTAGTYLAVWSLTGPGATGVRKEVSSFKALALTGIKAPDSQLKLGTVRLAARWYSRRLTPTALIELGDLGGARIPSFDPDIERLLRIGKYRAPVIA